MVVDADEKMMLPVLQANTHEEFGGYCKKHVMLHTYWDILKQRILVDHVGIVT